MVKCITDFNYWRRKMNRELLKKCLNEFYLIHETAGIRSADICEEIEKELSKPEPDPGAWMYHWEDGQLFGIYDKRHPLAHKLDIIEKLLYTSPPSREPLSEDEIEKLIHDTFGELCLLSSKDLFKMARAVEKYKNNLTTK